MELQGSIVQIKSRVSASGDLVTTVTLEVHGEISQIHQFMERPLSIQLNDSGQKNELP